MLQQPKWRIIGISGKFGSGKSTFTNHFLEKHPDYKRESFAESLRQMIAIMINKDVSMTRTAEGKNTMLPRWNKTVGQLLQQIGTDGIRAIIPDAWVWSLFDRFEKEESLWVIDDVRFPNEADAIREAGGIIVRFEGDPGLCYETLCTTRNPVHPSETALDNYEHFHCIIETGQYIDRLDSLYDAIFSQ